MIGEQVRLRLLERDDLEMAAIWRNDPRVAGQFFGCWPFALSEQEAWYDAYLTDPTQRMFIIESTHGHRIGCLALVNIDHRNQSAELGRVLIGDQNSLAVGCAEEGVRLLVAFAFEEVNLRRISVRVLAGNEPALALYKSCGFQLEGTLRGAVWKRGVFEDVASLALLRPCCDGGCGGKTL